MGVKALEIKRARKRRFRLLSAEERSELKRRVVYEGSPLHKREPNDFGLTPPAAPRSDKTLCDEAGVFEKATALELFDRALRVGLVSESTVGNGLPKHLWAVANGGQVFEAIHGGSCAGAYHAYPVRDGDPFAQRVRLRFREAIAEVGEGAVDE